MPVQHDQTLQGETRLHPNFMKDQQISVSDDEEYKCCTLEFDNEFDHLSHMISHIAENIILLQRVQCDHCNYSFNDNNELKKHLSEHHRGFNCYYCQQHLPSWRKLVEHVMYKHNYKIKHGKKSNSNQQHEKFKRRAHYFKNKKCFKRKMKTEIKKGNFDPIIKTEPGSMKSEPNVKSEPIFSANINNETIFNSRIIKTEPTDVKIETFDYN